MSGALAAASLSSHDVRFITGEPIVVDGGQPFRVLDFRAVIYHLDSEPRFHFGRYAESSPQPPLTKVLWPVM